MSGTTILLDSIWGENGCVGKRSGFRGRGGGGGPWPRPSWVLLPLLDRFRLPLVWCSSTLRCICHPSVASRQPTFKTPGFCVLPPPLATQMPGSGPGKNNRNINILAMTRKLSFHQWWQPKEVVVVICLVVYKQNHYSVLHFVPPFCVFFMCGIGSTHEQFISSRPIFFWNRFLTIIVGRHEEQISDPSCVVQYLSWPADFRAVLHCKVIGNDTIFKMFCFQKPRNYT